MHKKRSVTWGIHKRMTPLRPLADSLLSPSTHVSYVTNIVNITNHGSLQERFKPPAVCHHPEAQANPWKCHAMPSCAKVSLHIRSFFSLALRRSTLDLQNNLANETPKVPSWLSLVRKEFHSPRSHFVLYPIYTIICIYTDSRDRLGMGKRPQRRTNALSRQYVILLPTHGSVPLFLIRVAKNQGIDA